MKIELHDHQNEAVNKMHNGCVLWGGVGTGKTITSLAYALLREAGKKIVIVTTAKKRDSGDWEHEAGLLGVPYDLVEVTSWNKINDYITREDEFFIFDEQRLVGTGAWVKSFYKIAKKNHWILLSATPGDTWSDYAPMFIANGWYKNITEFRREHAVYSRYTAFPKIEKYIGEGRLIKYRKMLLVEMPMERHTKRHIHNVEVSFDRDTLDIVRKKRWNVYEDKPLKNAAELFGVMRKVVSTDESRREALKDLIATHPKLIVFYNYNYELEIMRELLTEISTSHDTGKNWIQNESGLILPESQISKSTSTNKSQSVGLSTLTQENTSTISWPDSTIQEKKSDTLPPWEIESTGWTKTQSPSGSIVNSRTSSGNRPTIQSTPMETGLMENPSELSQISKTRLMESKSGSQPTTGSSIDLSSTIYPGSPSTTTAFGTSMVPSVEGGGSFGWAEWNGHKHQPIPDTDRWVYLVQYASGSEGWNCIDTDSMAFWSLTYSWKQFNQAQGRIDRMNTPFVDLHYYILMTDSMAEKPVMMSLNKKQDFQPK